MIEKPKGRFIDKQDNDLPDSFEKYGLENIWEYIEKYWNDVESLTTNVSQALTDIDTLKTDVQELQPIDSLDSTSITRPLSANQGKMLNEKISGTVLYESSTGTNGNVSFSDNLSNYTRIKIFHKVVMTAYTANFVEEFLVNIGDVIALNSPRLNSDALWINDSARYTLTATGLTKEYECDVRIGVGGTAAFNSNTTRTLITKVVGFID